MFIFQTEDVVLPRNILLILTIDSLLILRAQLRLLFMILITLVESLALNHLYMIRFPFLSLINREKPF